MRDVLLVLFVILVAALLIGCAVMENRAVQAAAKLAVIEVIESSADPSEAAAEAYRFIDGVDGLLSVSGASVSIADIEDYIRGRIRESSWSMAKKAAVNEIATALLEDFVEGVGDDALFASSLDQAHVEKARRVLRGIRNAVELTGY